MRFPFCLARSLALLSLVLGCRIGADEVDYSADIQSLLARRCYSCHGPDQQEGSIRFDVRDSMLAEADSGEVPIVPGKADESELLRRVLSSDESEMMPPEGKRLSESEVELLAQVDR